MRADAIVLLGCRVGPGAKLGPAAARRARVAASAWRDGIAPLVIASGGRRWRGIAEAEALARELEACGVDADAIVPELLSMSTRENAHYSARLLRARSARTVAIVTCDWHMRRALWCFRAVGLDPFGMPALSPPAVRIERTRRWLTERAGLWLDRLAILGGVDP
jgi:uncharacterized SAM-binding protein YcdF (DUF218 family)